MVSSPVDCFVESGMLPANKQDILEWHARVLRKNWQASPISRTVGDKVIARYHLGVARRNIKKDPLKAWEFIKWAFQITPLGAISAMGWFFLEKMGKANRYA
jgi:hypothetical protein